MKNTHKALVFPLIWAALTITSGWFPVRAEGASSATVSIQANQPGAVISPDLFGIFFEEINFAGDGGIYAEMVRNRSFQEGTPSGTPSTSYWSLATPGSATGSFSADDTDPLNTNIVCSLLLTRNSGGGSDSVGVANSGYWGMSVESNAVYNLSLWTKDDGSFSGDVSARLENADGSMVYDQVTVCSPTPSWEKYTVALTPGTTDHNARLVVSINQAGSVRLAMVSLFPDNTFMGRENGLRKDLAEKLAAMNPAFLRFPGGNFIESPTVDNAVRWKKSIGPIEERPGHDNSSWGYWSTDGLGAHEFFDWCEDMNMEPLYDINAGLMLGYNGDPVNTVPLDEMGPWVQDALDLIEYANGDTNTTWGAVRAANGHPEPFNMKYLEIGNENGGTLLDERYTLFYDAIKPVYPDIHLIAAGGNWGGGPPWSRPVEIMDEHYYSNPASFISWANKYDSYDRNGSKVFVGEYAVTSGYGTYGNLAAALGEAAFMTGMERNSDIVVLAAYAPMFANVNGIQWHPDLIYYDSSRCFGTPAYYVQKMFSRNTGDYVLPTSVNISSTSNPPPHGAIGVGSWNTAVEYDDIAVTSNGVPLYNTDFSSGAGEWNVYKGTWGVSGGAYQQTDIATDCRSTTGDTNWENYTLSLRARKLAGDEGFLILFNWQDDNNWTWLNIGGWNNSQHAIEQTVNGGKTTVATASGSINSGQWYDIDIVVSNYNVKCYLDSTLILEHNYSPIASSGLYATTSFDNASGEVVIKAVNPYDTVVDTTFDLSGVASVAASGTLVQLTSGSASDENSFGNPTYVSPTTNAISNADTNFIVSLPANSLSVLRLTPADVDNYTDLMLDIPSPIGTGGQVASTLWGYQSGGWVNLSSNTTYAITYASQDSNIATVDSSGTVSGISFGATGIIATYNALGLSVTQSVQVVSAPTGLTAAALGDSQIRLGWDAFDEALSYTLKRSDTSGGPYTAIASGITNTSFIDTGLTVNDAFYYVVSASTAVGDSFDSAEVRGDTALAVGEWNFDQNLGFTNSPLSDHPAMDLTGNSNTMYGYDATYGPYYSSLGDTPSGTGLSLDANGNQDAYLDDSASSPVLNLNTWSPESWSIEASVVMDDLGSYETFIGKDGTMHSQSESDFYLQKTGSSGDIRVALSTVSGQRVNLSTGFYPATNEWFHVAVTSDGGTLSIYINDGTGWSLKGTEALTGGSMANNALANGNGANWTFLRGWYDGGFTDHVDGRMDNVRFSRGALSPHAFLYDAGLTVPGIPTGLVANAVSAGEIGLTWSASADATGYYVKRSADSGGPYVIVGEASNPGFSDTNVTAGVSYYYVVSAVSDSAQSSNSAEVSAVPSSTVSSNEFYFADYAVVGGSNLSLTVSNSVLGHDYGMLATDSLTPPAWSNILIEPGTGSNLLFGIPIAPDSTNRYFKLDVMRQ